MPACHLLNPMKTAASSAADCADSSPCEELVRDYAYHLYEQSNRVPGRDLENWLEASACLRARIPTQESGERLHRHMAINGYAASPSALAAVATASTAPSLPSVAAPVRSTALRAKR